jgi:hypothetical protein
VASLLGRHRDTAEGISWIEQGIRDYRATGTVLGLPAHLARKAEALHLEDRTSDLKLLKQSTRRKHWLKDLSSVSIFPACTGSAVCFSRLWVRTRPKLRLRSAKPSESQRSRSQFLLEKRAEATYGEYRRQKASGSGGRGFRLPLCNLPRMTIKTGPSTRFQPNTGLITVIRIMRGED